MYDVKKQYQGLDRLTPISGAKISKLEVANEVVLLKDSIRGGLCGF